MLDAKVSAENTNFIGYMGPNEAAKEFIPPEILNDPTVNPDQAILDKLQELLDLRPPSTTSTCSAGRRSGRG